MKGSLQKKLIRNNLLVVILTLVILDATIILGFSQYSYSGIGYYVSKQLESSLEIYQRYFLGQDLDEIMKHDFQIIWSNFPGQAQLINTDKELLYDSIGAINDPVHSYEDVKLALKGETATRMGEVNYSKEPVISTSAPMLNDMGGVIGVIRFTTSLKSINELLLKMSVYLVGVTIFVAFISVIFTYFSAKSIVKPIIEIKDSAELMADGSYKKRIKIDRDDEFGQVAKALNTLATEIIRKEQIKNDFISSISHELRTPLTSIKGWAVILRDMDNVDIELNREGLEIIENESDRLSKMVEELLDFSRYVSGRITLKKEDFDITATCKDIIRQMQPRAKNEGLTLKSEIEEVPTVISGDEDRIRQILINLIDNSIKFSREKGWVLLETIKSDEFYDIIVSDNGVGIDSEELSLVKEKFYKGRHSKSHSGLGLSIADEIARLHNGSINIVSEVGVGTTIRVRIPLKSEEIE